MPASERWSSLFACSLTLLAPFVIFLRHHDYPLLRMDVALASGVIALAGLVFGLLLVLAPAAIRAAVGAFIILLFVDLQTAWIREAWAAFLVFVVTGLLCWRLRDHLGRGLAFVAAIMIVSTLPMPSGDGWIQRRAFETTAEPNSSLPAIVHIVLDEQAAIDGIPQAFDPGGRVRNEIQQTYLDLGFRVFTRAFSRHFTTPPSLSHLVNLSSGDRSFEFYDPDSKSITRNAYFETMSRRGYRVRVLQTDYIDLCQPAGDVAFEHCVTYTLESIKALEASALSVSDRARAIVGSYGQLSQLLQSWRREYRRMAQKLGESGIPLPAWPLLAGRLSTVSSRQFLPVLEAELAHASRGTLTFAHLLLPHFPYAYDRACRLRPAPLEWRTYKAPDLRPTRNDPRTRAERYRLYLEQLECTNRLVSEMLARVLEAEALRDAIVIVHGDHGSRINLTTPNRMNLERMGPADFTDAFATHFAYRTPGVGYSGLDSRSVAIETILAALVNQGAVPEGSDWIGSQNVYITGERRDQVVHRPMRWHSAVGE